MSERVCLSCRFPLDDRFKFCPSCGTPTSVEPAWSGDTLHKNTAGTIGRKRMTTRSRALYGILASGLFGFFAYLFVEYLPGRPDPVIEKQPEVEMASMYNGVNLSQQQVNARVENGKIVISLPDLLQKKIVSFDYAGLNTTVPLLAFISNDGKLVTCFRMCEPCNSKMFRIEGSELACGNCETHWKLNNLEGTHGSCQKYPPAPIPSAVVGNEIQIEENVVRNWKMRI